MAGKKGSIKAGGAFVVIEAFDKTGAVLRKISKRMTNFADRMKNLGRDMVRQSLAILAPAGLSTKIFAGFDDSMRKVEARSTGTREQMEALRDEAKRLGRETSFTASQIGELQAKLAQKGFNRQEIKDMTKDVVNLARAAGSGDGEVDSVVSADLISATIRAFQMEAQDATRIADIFTAAVNNSNFDLESLADGMAKASPLAKDFGLSIEETVASLAAMTNIGISASEAGTAFQSFLARMSKSEFTGSFNRGLQELTGNTIQFTDAAGNLRKPLEIMSEIAKATEGMGTAQRGDLLSVLFGVRQFGKASGSARGAGDAMELLTLLLNDADNAAADTAETMDAGLGGSFRKILSAAEGVAIAIGESIAPALKSLTDFLTSYLQTAAEWIENNRGIIIGVVAIGAGIAGAGVALIGFAVLVKLAALALAGLAAVITVVKMLLAVLVSPIGLVVLAFAAAIAILWNFSTTFRGVIGDLVGWFKEKFGGMAETITGTFQGLLDAFHLGDFQAAWEILVSGMTLAWLQFIDVIKDTWNDARMFVVEVWHGAILMIKNFFIDVLAFMLKELSKLGDAAQAVGFGLSAVTGVQTFSQLGMVAGTLGNMSEEERNAAIDAAREEMKRRNEEAAGAALNEFAQGIEEANRGREEEIAERKNALETLLDEIEARREAAEMADEEVADGGAGDEPGINTDLPTGRIASQAIGGLEAGSVEAAKKAIENANRAPERLDTERNEILEDIREAIENGLLIGAI